MGAITPDKKIYDQMTVEAFNRAGWKAFEVAKTGRYADVIGLRGSSLAVVEVKSPNETSAVRGYDDSANLSPELDRKIGRYLRETRIKVFNLFGSGKAVQQLYAVSVASQLYRYIHEFEEKAGDYEKAVNGSVRLAGVRLSKTAYLAVPVELSDEAQEAMNVIRAAGYISSFRVWASPPVFIIEAPLSQSN